MFWLLFSALLNFCVYNNTVFSIKFYFSPKIVDRAFNYFAGLREVPPPATFWPILKRFGLFFFIIQLQIHNIDVCQITW